MSENRVKHVRHYSVRKREAREFHGSGLISNHVNLACNQEGVMNLGLGTSAGIGE